MALPTAFANLVNPTGPELDSDLSACGVIGIIPCTVSGSANAIIMKAREHWFADEKK